MNLAMGQFGNAEVAFAFPGQRIPAELQIEFELLRMSDRTPAMLIDWIARLERLLQAQAAAPKDEKPLSLRLTPSAVDKAAKQAAFQCWFGIGRVSASTLFWLYTAKGQPTSTEQLAVLESTNRDEVMVRVSRIRQAMECEAIDSERGVGYWLTDIGLAECRTAMEQFRESLES